MFIIGETGFGHIWKFSVILSNRRIKNKVHFKNMQIFEYDAGSRAQEAMNSDNS